MLNIIVCLKQVPDPEAPSSVYRIDDDGKHVICKGVPPVISTYDEMRWRLHCVLKTSWNAK